MTAGDGKHDDGGHPPKPRLTLSVGITGHRPPIFTPAHETALAATLNELFAALADAVRPVRAENSAFFASEAPALRLVTPLAEGADQLAAQCALTNGYAIQALLPLPREEYRRDFSPSGAEAFDALVASAACVLELPIAAAGRDHAYALAGRATLAHADLVVALWDGNPSRGRGGTAEIVAAALRRDLPVVHVPLDGGPVRILWTGWGIFLDPDRIDALPWRVASADELQALLGALLAPPADERERDFIGQFLGEHEWRNRRRAEYPLMLAAFGIAPLRRSAFRVDRYHASISEEWKGFRTACRDGDHGVEAALDPIERAYGWADRLAQHFAQTYRSGHILNFLLGAVAVLLALGSLLVPGVKLEFVIAELVAVAGFVINTRFGVRGEWHRRWLDYRQLAERIRPMRSLKLLGAAAPAVARGRGGTMRWLDWYAAATWRASGCASGRVRDESAATRLIIDEELSPQISWHRASAERMHLLDHRLHGVGMALFILSLMSGLAFVTGYFIAHAWVRAHADVFVALSAGLPAIGAAIFGIRVQGDFSGTAERSAATAAELAAIVEALEASRPDLARTIDLVEGAAAMMLADLGEWRLAFKQRQIQLPT